MDIEFNPTLRADSFSIQPFKPYECQMALIDFTLSNARRFYSSMGNPLGLKGLTLFPCLDSYAVGGPEVSRSLDPRPRSYGLGSVEDDPFIEAHFASMQSMTSPSDKKKKADNSVNYGYLSQGMKGKFSAHNTCTLCSRVQVKLASLRV